MKGNKGITLIALVITIIVLLILAGVSIAMLSGDNSILKQAQNARDNSAAGTLEETVKIAVGNIMTANLEWPTGVTFSGTKTTVEGETNTPNKDLVYEINQVNPSLKITSASVADSSVSGNKTITATINGQTQKIDVTVSSGAVVEAPST